MSKDDRIWREGEPEWIWLAGETVPRYKWSQMSQEEIVSNLNNVTELENEIAILDADLESWTGIYKAKVEALEGAARAIVKNADRPNYQNMTVVVCAHDFGQLAELTGGEKG